MKNREISDSEIEELKYYFDSLRDISISRIDNNDLNSVKKTLSFLIKSYIKILKKSTNETYKILFDEKQPEIRDTQLFIHDIGSYEIDDNYLPLEINNQLPILELPKEPDYLFIKLYKLLFDVCEYSAKKGQTSIAVDVLDTLWNLLIITINIIQNITLKRKITAYFFSLYNEIVRLGFIWESQDEYNEYHHYIDMAAYEWYRDLLFHSTLTYIQLIEIEAEKNYLNCVETFLKANNEEHFKKFIDFIHIGSHNKIEVTKSYKIENILLKENHYNILGIVNVDMGIIRELDSHSDKLFTYNELTEWKNEYDKTINNLRKLVKENINPFNAIYQNNIKQAEYNFLANQYRITIANVVIYLLKNKKYEEVLSVAGINLNHNFWNLSSIFFSDFEELLKLLINKNYFFNTKGLRINLLQNEKNYYQYFIILLFSKNHNNNYINQVIKKERTPNKLSLLLFEFKKMLEYHNSRFGLDSEEYENKFIGLIKKIQGSEIGYNEITKTISFLISQYETYLENELPSILSISSELVENFKFHFQEKYKQNILLRNIIRYDENQELTINNNVKLYGFNLLLDRKMFIKDWYATYIGMQQYGIEFADYEHFIIGNELFNSSTQFELRKTDILDFMEKKVENDHIIIGFNFFFYYEIFRNYNLFNPEWEMRNVNDEAIRKNEGFQGLYKGNNEVFTIRDSSKEKRILIIRKKHLNFLKQYLPVSNIEDTFLPELEIIAKHIGFSIADFGGENGEIIIEEQLKKYQSWLPAFKTKEDKIDYLKTKVWLRALQKLEIDISSDFDAITIIVKD